MLRGIKWVFGIWLFLLFASPLCAEYILPYPSYMPGHKLYGVSRFFDKAMEYWNYGNIAKTKYHLKLADKYLVEAKTLFEYKQYLFAADALVRSDVQFEKLPKDIEEVRLKQVDTMALARTVEEAAGTHILVLRNVLSTTPTEFLWDPEKGQKKTLDLAKMLEQAIGLRERSIKELR